MPISLDDYATYARGEIPSRGIGDRTREYAGGWRKVLGGLYRGSIGKTGEDDAVIYARKFLPAYNHVHDLERRKVPDHSRSDFFTMLRDKPLHGFTPAGILTHDRKRVSAWWIGAVPTHVEVGLTVTVDCLTLVEDLCTSMEKFAAYLDENTDKIEGGHRVPCDRWQRAFWARYCPDGYPPQEWIAFGEKNYNIPK